MAILGMVVNLVTFDSEDAGTDDEIYIGLWGSAGGREFPLSSKDHEDFDRSANDLYVIGVDPGFGMPLIRSDRSAPGEANDPALVPIDLNSIQYVYVRKQAYGTDGRRRLAPRFGHCAALRRQHSAADGAAPVRALCTGRDVVRKRARSPSVVVGERHRWA